VPWEFVHSLYLKVSNSILKISKAKLTCEVYPGPPSSLDGILVGKAKDELVVDKLSKSSGHERDADVQFDIRGVVFPAGHSLG
jgi:hypothetical protein